MRAGKITGCQQNVSFVPAVIFFKTHHNVIHEHDCIYYEYILLDSQCDDFKIQMSILR